MIPCLWFDIGHINILLMLLILFLVILVIFVIFNIVVLINLVLSGAHHQLCVLSQRHRLLLLLLHALAIIGFLNCLQYIWHLVIDRATCCDQPQP